MKWQWDELIEAVKPCKRASLDRIPGPGRRAGTKHQAALDLIGKKVGELWAKWGVTRLEAGDEAGRAGLTKDLSAFHEAWQGIARDEVHFMTGCGLSGDVGKAMEFEENTPCVFGDWSGLRQA